MLRPESWYDDGRALLDRTGITLRHYYFPTGRSKHLPYRKIRDAHARPMSWLTGRGRLWGSANARDWLPLDLSRPRKRTLVVLDVGARVQPSFSPDDPERVLALLRKHIAAG